MSLCIVLLPIYDKLIKCGLLSRYAVDTVCICSLFVCYIFCIIIIIIIIIIDLITLPSIYLLGNLHLSQRVGGIRLSQGKEIHPIPKGQAACTRNLHTIWHFHNGTAFCPTLKMFLVKPVFSRHFRKCCWPLVPLRWLRGILYRYVVKFPHIFISRPKFSYFVIFSVSVLERL